MDNFDFEADAEQLAPNQDQLQSIDAFVLQILELQGKIAFHENETTNLCAQLRRIQQVDLPSAMMSANTEKWTANNGITVKMEDKLELSIGDSNRAKILKWLRDTKNDSLIKGEIEIEVPKGTPKQLTKEIVAFLKQTKLPYSLAETAHTGSVKALMRKSLETGTLDSDTLKDLGAWSARIATVKMPKETATKSNTEDNNV